MFYIVLVTMFKHFCVACLFKSHSSLFSTLNIVSSFINASLFVIFSASVLPNNALYSTCDGILSFSSSFNLFHAVAVATFWIHFYKLFCLLQLAKCVWVSF